MVPFVSIHFVLGRVEGYVNKRPGIVKSLPQLYFSIKMDQQNPILNFTHGKKSMQGGGGVYLPGITLKYCLA